MSLSGSERNNAFVRNRQGVYVDVSGNSGLDSKSDGRSIAVFDLDHDGYHDFLLTNTNHRTLQIFQNAVGKIQSERGFIVVRVVGGNRRNVPNDKLSSRDAVGAAIRVSNGQITRTREVRCGEGLAAQNTSNYIFGLNQDDTADVVEVIWPSGARSVATEIPSGNLITFFEVSEETNDGSGFVVSPYIRQDVNQQNEGSITLPPELIESVNLTHGNVYVFTAMATWCQSCRNHIADVNLLMNSDEQASVIAVPVDSDDTDAALREYVQQHKPQYELLAADSGRSQAFLKLAADSLGSAELPFSIIVDGHGKVIRVLAGIPTISQLRQAKN